MNRLLIGSILLAIFFGQDGQLPAQSVPQLAATPKKPTIIKKKVVSPPEPLAQVVINKSTIDDGGVRYELTSCRRLVDSLVCRLLLTNKTEADIVASLKTSGTRFIDITGEEYLAKEVQIGSNKSDATTESILISQVPIKALITFDAPATNVVTLKVLAINHEPGKTLKFREVKIAKVTT